MSTTTDHPRPAQYSGKVTRVGNSRGIRLDAAFFKAHPEFADEVSATVLADGQVLLSAKPPARSSRRSESDPVALAFLSFLGQQLATRPELIEPADAKQLARIARLVKGVAVD